MRGALQVRGAARWRRVPPAPLQQRPRCRHLNSSGTPSGTGRPTVTDGVLPPELLRRVAPEVLERGSFMPLHDQPAEVRTDQILWLNQELALERGMIHTAEAIQLFRAHITESLLSRPAVGNLLLPRRVMLSCYDGASESDPAGMYAAHRDGFATPTWRDGLDYAAEVGRYPKNDEFCIQNDGFYI